MEYFAVLSVVVLFVAVLSWFFYPRHHRNLPPGPYPFPIIGNIHQLGQNPNQSLAKLSKKYGPLMSIHLGSIHTIVVSSPEMAKEVLVKNGHAFSSRLIPAALQAHDHDKLSMAFLPIGKEWRKFRKLGKEEMFLASRLECSRPVREEKLQKLCDYVGRCCESGRSVNIGEVIFITTLNLMSETLFSTEVTSFDSEGATHDFKTTLESIVNLTGAANFADYFPVLKPLDPQGIKRTAEIYFGKLLAFIEDLINQRLESRRSCLDEDKNTDFLETLLDLQEDESNDYDLSIKFIQHFLLDLFVGGSETTSSSVEWAMTELLLNPEILSKAKHEIKSVAGDNERLNESEILKLPYLQAVIKETLRYHPPGPLLIPRKSEYDTHVSGYYIPKDTQLLVNVWAMGRDPTMWSDPESFEPERFLSNKNIDFKGQDFELIPFGAGRRLCPGLPLANRILHITVATLIHNFDWKLVQDGQDHKAEVFGLALRKAVPLVAIPKRSTPIASIN
ncbi:hypothetical protein ACP275_04G155400 [Erythranthe tilingii]